MTGGATRGPEQGGLAAAEVRAAFDRYEAALRSGDLATMAELFDEGDQVVRFGIADEQRGAAALAAWRAVQAAPRPGRRLEGTTITVLCADAAVVSTRFAYPDRPRIGRQQQTWVRRGGGWRIAAAHVSEIDAPAMPPP
ncbi:MAG: DUF3225 domain-containing protein [Actinomycetota bacterium]|nr:DUF3225 domain-containing protein [Actinomycetota bacterium]